MNKEHEPFFASPADKKAEAKEAEAKEEKKAEAKEAREAKKAEEAEEEKYVPVKTYGIWNVGLNELQLVAGDDKDLAKDALQHAFENQGESVPDFRLVLIEEVKGGKK